MRVIPVVFLPLRIPANEANYKTQSAFPVLDNVTVYSVTPHMHLLGKEMTVTAELKDGTKKPLVKIPYLPLLLFKSDFTQSLIKVFAGSSIGLENQQGLQQG